MPTYAVNKKATFDYEILDTFEAGLVLTGQEVKSIRGKHINLKGSFVSFHNNEAFLNNAHISKYKFDGITKDYDPDKARKLLLSKKEIDLLRGKTMEKGLTVVALSVYTRGSKIKVKIGIAKGKKKHDKRKSIKDRENKKDMDRAVKGSYE